MRLEKAENLPPIGVYKRLCHEFLNSGEECMKVILEESDAKLTPAMLCRTLASTINSNPSLYGRVGVRQRKDDVFLVLMESGEESDFYKDNEFLETDFVTISEAVERSGLSEYFWRTILRMGKCPHIKIGTKYMVDYNKAIEFIKSTGGKADA